MADNPLNLALRFLLELAILAALACWGWSHGEGAMRWVLAIGSPLAAAILWGVFRVPNDGGPPVITVPGPARLLLEALLFGLAIWGLALSGHQTLALIFGAVTVAHYAISYDRTLRLLRGK